MKRKLLLLSIISLFSVSAYSQWSLGDIAFSNYHSDTTTPDDHFTIVLLRDVTIGEEIEFTENGWFAAGGFRSGESICRLTFGNNYTSGTQIIISKSPFEALDQDNVSAGTLTGSGLNLATGGDQIFAYDPANIPAAGSESGFIAAIHMNGDWGTDSTSSTTSAKPSVFTDGLNSISINPEVDNARISAANCSGFSDIASLRVLLNTATNWETSNTPFVEAPIPTICDFRNTLSIETPELNTTLNIYPNPTSDKITIGGSIAEKSLTIEIYSLMGRKVLVHKNDNTNSISVQHLNSGIYLAKIMDNNNKQTITKKIVIK